MRAVVEKTQRQGLVPLSLLTAADGSNYSLNGQKKMVPTGPSVFKLSSGSSNGLLGTKYLVSKKGLWLSAGRTLFCDYEDHVLWLYLQFALLVLRGGLHTVSFSEQDIATVNTTFDYCQA